MASGREAAFDEGLIELSRLMTEPARLSITAGMHVTALHIAVGEEQTRRLLERRVNHVWANGRFLIEQYVVGVECDAPWARGVLVKAEVPEQVAQYKAVPGGC